MVFGAVVVALAIFAAMATRAAADAAQPGVAARQGCVNQGRDLRVAGAFVCWAQRHLSWKSPHRPHFLLIGKPAGRSIGLAWPPYLVVNAPSSQGRWRMFRVGFRYDRNWRGYIFPTAAWKIVKRPLEY
jgi:hypothetical protein